MKENMKEIMIMEYVLDCGYCLNRSNFFPKLIEPCKTCHIQYKKTGKSLFKFDKDQDLPP